MKVPDLEETPRIAFIVLAVIFFVDLFIIAFMKSDPLTASALLKEFFLALPESLKGFSSAFAIIFSVKIASKTLLNNRFYELHKNFYSSDMLKARQAVDKESESLLSSEDELDRIYEGLCNKAEGGDQELTKEEEKYYHILRFAVFLNEACLAYRTGMVPKKEFIRIFGPNILAYKDKLNVFIRHRQNKKSRCTFIEDRLGELN